MATRQTRIFVRSDDIQADWAETLLGRVFAPLISEFETSLEWFWFSRYGAVTSDSGDCDITQIGEDYKQPLQPGGEGFHRSLRFRFSVADRRQEEFERRGRELIDAHGYSISDFRPYDHVADTGTDRFLGTESRVPGRSERRANLIINYLTSISKLILDALVGPDGQGRYQLESNDDHLQNPRGSTFQSLLHLFCNMTNCPTDVYVFQNTQQRLLGYGTFIYPPPEPPGGWDGVTAFSIRY